MASSRRPCVTSSVCLAAVLGCLGASALAEGAKPTVLVTVVASDRAPKIDGVISSDEWQGAASVSGFAELKSGQLATVQPMVWLCFDSKALYCAARVPLPKGRRPVARARGRDSQVYQDDSVELFFDPSRSRSDYFQIILNSAGALFDAHKTDRSWNGQMQCAGRAGKGQWEVELAIPYAALGASVPRDGQVWGFNACVNSPTWRATMSWAKVKSGFREPESFGGLRFSRRGPGLCLVDARALGGTGDSVQVGLAGTGSVNARLSLSRETAKGVQEFPGSTCALGEAVREGTLKLNRPKEQGFDAQGRYNGVITARATGTRNIIFSLPFAYVTKPALDLSARAFVRDRSLEVAASVQKAALSKGLSCRVSLAAKNAASTKSVVLKPSLATGTAIAKFTSAEVPPGLVTLAGALLDKAGRQVYTVEKTLHMPLSPTWVDDKTGVTDRVMPPWTPLTVQGDCVRPWGRSYSFTECLLPREVVTRDASVLASPVALRAVVAKRDLKWSGAPAKIVASEPHQVRLEGSARNSAFALTGSAVVEYDGMIRVDLELAPQRAIKLDELVLEIPLKSKHSKYLYHFPGKWRTVANSGYLPEAGWTHAFKPFVWLGDEDRGFSWFCESDRGWLPYDREDAITVDREAGRNVLRLHLIKDAVVSRPLKYTFGFHATPVKQSDKDVWDYRICHMGSYDLPDRLYRMSGSIQYPAQGHIRGDRGTFEAWVSLAQDSDPALAPRPHKECPNEHLLVVSFPDDKGTEGSNCGIFWVGPNQAIRIWVREDGKVLFTADAPVKWKKGQMHHVAFSWGEEVRIYIDGELKCSRRRKGLTTKPMERATLYVGGKSGPPRAVDEVRISDIARAPDLAAQPYKPDAHALLLDHLDELVLAPRGRMTRPAKSAAGAPGMLSDGPKLIAGRHGKALQLSGDHAGYRLLDRLADAGVRTICFHSQWTNIGYTSPPPGREDDLKRLVRACHAKGIQLLLYHTWFIPDEAPEYELYIEDIRVTPGGRGFRYKPGHFAPTVCWCSHWREFCLSGMAKLIDEFDVDGFYLDGNEWPMFCNNVRHGCGYLRPDGTRAREHNIFATRDFMKRLYVLCKTRKPDAQVNIHNSTVMVIPTLGWGTSSWGGEQLGSLSFEGGGAVAGVNNVLDVLPLDAFRTEFMGRQWGVPSEFLCYERPYTTSEALSITLLHGVLVRPNNPGRHLDIMSGLWRLADSFGLKQAVWHPYWNNREMVRSSAQGVEVSVYSRAEKGALAIVSNMSGKAAAGELEFSLAALKLPMRVRAVDALTGEPRTIERGRLPFSIPALGYEIIWLRP